MANPFSALLGSLGGGAGSVGIAGLASPSQTVAIGGLAGPTPTIAIPPVAAPSPAGFGGSSIGIGSPVGLAPNAGSLGVSAPAPGSLGIVAPSVGSVASAGPALGGASGGLGAAIGVLTGVASDTTAPQTIGNAVQAVPLLGSIIASALNIPSSYLTLVQNLPLSALGPLGASLGSLVGESWSGAVGTSKGSGGATGHSKRDDASQANEMDQQMPDVGQALENLKMPSDDLMQRLMLLDELRQLLESKDASSEQADAS